MFSVLSSIYYKEDPNAFHACMESIWKYQSVKPFEMILVEDGKLTPELYKEIEFWSSKLGHILKIIKIKENVGTGKAKNLGLQHCSYEIVCIVDTDDICVENRFELQLDYFKNHPEITILGGQIIEFNENINNPSGSRHVPEEHDALVNYAQKQSPFNNMTIAYKKEHIVNVGGYQHHLWMEDYNLFLRLIAANYKLHNLNDILVYARVDNGMHGRRKGLAYIKSEFQLMKTKINLQLQNPLQAFIIFFLRSSVRLLPSKMLASIYNVFLRKKVTK